MSDTEEVVDTPMEETEETGGEVDVGEMDIMKALQEVLKKSLVHDGLVRGLREAAKALDRREAQLCVLASDCDAKDYTKLIEGLCAEHEVSLVRVPDKKQLGEWAGLCKIDAEGNATKVVGATCVVVKDFGEPSRGYDFLLEFISNKDE
jgi:small subunit ribosomal protein S12e